jgi:phosphonate transport system ATP-binding protein
LRSDPLSRTALYDIDSLTLAYDEAPVLENISLRIDSGEKVVIIGPSGSGKSTLLKKLYELRQERCSFIHQDYALIPQLSAFHNVYAGRLDSSGTFSNLLNLVRPQEDSLAKIRPIFQSLEMEEKINERVSNLSGGQQQRIAVGRAIFRRSDILLADEPVSSIDPHQAGAVLQLIKQSSPTVVLAMHDVRLALEHFPRVIGLREKRVAFDLPAAQVDDPVLRELYAGE